MFCFPDVYSYRSRVMHDRLKATLHCLRHSSAHSRSWTSKLRYLWIMRDFASSWVTEQPIFVRGRLCRDTQITPRRCSLPCFSLSCCRGMRSRSVIRLDLYRTRRIGAHAGQVARLCYGNVLSCWYCVTFGTVGLGKCKSLLEELSTQVRIIH